MLRPTEVVRGVVLLGVVLATVSPRTGQAAPGAREHGEIPVPVTVVSAEASALRTGSAQEWETAVEMPLLLQRTPPIYEGDPVDDGYRPAAAVALLQSGDSLYVRLRWSDPTDSAPEPPVRYPDGGEEHIYKLHSRDLERFADAACVMVPVTQGSTGSYPTIMMGDPEDPVNLFYWNRARGFEVLGAVGRSAVESTGRTLHGTRRRNGDEWDVIFEIPAQAPGTPIAFAVWDGDRGQRSGLKFFSMWYEVTP